MQVTRTLARFLTESRVDSVPVTVRREAKRALLNFVGCAIGACRHETVQRALAALGEFSGPPQASVLGRDERLDVLHAALVNGMSSHVFDFDDTHLDTAIHPSAPVAAALLALAEHRPVSGAQFLHAFILGVEAECRIGRAVYPSHYDVGWHITATAGVFGAAAACGHLLRLDEQRMTWALGIAATQASGLREMFGTMCKPFHPGRAAHNGLTAALLAAQGFTSSEQALEARRGFTHVTATERDLAAVTRSLGDTWEIVRNTYKPFACGVVMHPAIEACIHLRAAHAIGPEAIEWIHLQVHPLVSELTGRKSPRTGLESKFSVYHGCAVAIVHGAAGEAEFSDASVLDPGIVALRGRVQTEVDRSLGEDQVRIAIGLRDGRVLEHFVEHVTGSIARPLSDADLEAKFRGLVAPHLAAAQTDALLALLRGVEALADAGAIARACQPGARLP